MEISEVKTKKTRKIFLDVPRILYRHDKTWVCPLDSQIESIFDSMKNISFRDGDAKRWILKDDSGKPIGRISGFFNHRRANINKQPTGGVGFFECINDQEAAGILFDTAKNWLDSHGMEAMDGPINFGENDSHWGLLVEGFTHPGFGMPYNKPYYKTLFENYGFRNYFNQYSYHVDLSVVKEFPERFEKIVTWVSRKPDYEFRHFSFKETARYANDMIEAYNSTWSMFKEDFSPLELEVLLESFRKTKAFIDEDLIWFAYAGEKAVAFFILFPDLNQILKHMNGKLNLLNMIRFLYYKRKHEMTRVRAVIAGVHPRYQNLGLESVIFKRLFEVFKRKPYYKELELSWVGDFNPKMKAIYEAIGGVLAKTHVTYRYLFDRDITFRRYLDEMAEDNRGRDKK